MSVVTTSNTQEKSSFPFQCPMLTSMNYTTWAIKMEALMDAQGVWEAIQPEVGAAVDEKKSKMARAFIFQAIPEEILLQVAKKKTAKEVWDSLKTRYIGAERVQKARQHTLKSEFESLRMKEGETIDEYAGKLSGMISKYNSVGAVLEDEELVRKLFDTVTEKFIHLVASMEQYSEVETMPFEEAIGRLKAYEDRLKLRKGASSGETSLLFTKVETQSQGKSNQKSSSSRGKGITTDRGGRSGSRGRGSSRGRGGRGSSNTSREAGGWNQKPRDKKHVRCYNCQNFGHYASECKGEKKEEHEVHLTKDQDDEPSLFLSVYGEEEQCVALLHEERLNPKMLEERVDASRDMWYLDNGASNHMTGRKDAFVELNQSVTGYVRFGDGSRVSIEGKGTLLFIGKTGDQLMIENVYYIPALTSNILSLGQLAEVGYNALIRGDHLKLYNDQEELVMKVQRAANRLYKIMLTLDKPVCLKASLDEDAWIWHARLGHANFQIIEALGRKGLATGIPCLSHPRQVCEGCLVAKQTRKSFPHEAQWRASKPLELLHADLCGPITPQSKGGNSYFLLIVDDFSRYMWVYLLKSKDEALSYFKIFKSKVERESEYKVKTLRTDLGGEFNSQAFKEFCQEKGIRRQTTAPYTPQQNGVVERKNRTVLGMTRSFLKAKNVPETLWGEAVRHTVYILNRIPTKAVKDTTPYESWKKTKPNLQYLKIFGCLAHVKVMSGHQKKLEDRSTPMVYLGKEQNSKAYRLLNPKTSKLVISRDVVFQEDKSWKWEKGVRDESPSSSTWATYMHEVGGAHGQSSSGIHDGNYSTPLHTNVLNSPHYSFAGTPITCSSSQNDKSEHGESDKSAHGEGRMHVTVPFEDESPFKGFRDMGDVHQRTKTLNEEQTRDLYVREGELLLIGEEPLSYRDAATDRDWVKAMRVELDAIEKNKTWSLTPLPNNQKAIGLKWVFKLKKDANGKVIRHKARLVAKGYVQLKGVDFDDAFAPVARMETVRVILAMAATNGWLVHHLDVKSAFLNGELQEEVYVCQPDGFEVKGKENHVYKLHKALYGLKQAPRAWNYKLDKTLKELGFSKCTHEPAVYMIKKSGSVLLLGVYVDDIILTGSREKDVEMFKEKMKASFDMSDMGLLSYYLGIEVKQEKGEITLMQSAYAKKILKLARMERCNPSQYPMEHRLSLTKEGEGAAVDPTYYRQLIGSLRYLVHTQPDLCYSVGVVSRFMEAPKESHLAAVKHILRYIKGTIFNGLKYGAGGDGKLVGYSDSSYGNDIIDRRGTTGTIFYYSDNAITWSSQKQRTVALSSCEAEFMAATDAARQAIWLRNLISEISGLEPQCVKLKVDNEGAIALMKNPVFHGRSKHIDTKYHFIRECVERNLIFVEHVDGKLQKADMLTKALPRVKFEEMKELIGVKVCPHQGESVG
ncbi:hypothetical protein SSX86_003310 [Deinandra increscens subsp. villosa]|uniref:Polyprotein n=1 Tax=Deinandra increscens subsp. villosa TaxID=3103831 RepID=A0AAP0DI35_9ASTR